MNFTRRGINKEGPEKPDPAKTRCFMTRKDFHMQTLWIDLYMRIFQWFRNLYIAKTYGLNKSSPYYDK